MSKYIEQVDFIIERGIKKYSAEDLLVWLESIYNYTIPEGGKEEGEHPFGLLDYYEMETIGAFLKQTLKGGEK